MNPRDLTPAASVEGESVATADPLILEISKLLLGLSSESFDDGMILAFQTLAEAFAADRISFFAFEEDPGLPRRIYRWRRDGGTLRHGKKLLFARPDQTRFFWMNQHLSRLELLHVPDTRKLPQEAQTEREYCERRQIASFVAVPVASLERPLGFFTCSWIQQAVHCSDRQLTSLKVFGEILANTLIRREAEEALFREKERALVTLASIGDGVIRTDRAGRIDYLNPVAEQLTGWTDEEATGREVREVYHVYSEATRRPRRNPVEICVAERRTIILPGLFTLHSKHGEEFTIRDCVAPILDRAGEIDGTVLVFRDLTQIRGLEREMAYLASHDPLTGLINRQEFEIYLEAALESARERKVRHVLLYLDLLQFKLINDCFGHVAGDELLRQIATLLKNQVASEDVVARLGGDQFAVLLESRNTAQARGLASDLQKRLRDFRFSWGGQFFDIESAIGLVPINANSDSVVQILKAAESACFVARDKGRHRVHVAVPDDATLTEHSGRLQWVHRIRRALAEDGFCLYHQKILPILGDGEAALHEILVRWISETGEHVAPGVFIPIAESYELGPLLDRWVIRQTLKFIGRTSESSLASDPVSINLSGQSLGDDRMRDFICEHLETSGVSPERIFFEITETATVANLNRALSFIHELKQIGCRFILDDFGSGLCSFAYLKNLPVDLLKIDGEFVRNMEQDPIRRAMLESINQIGQVMGLATIAEWVENQETFETLRDLGVDYAQGYWLHRPQLLVAP